VIDDGQGNQLRVSEAILKCLEKLEAMEERIFKPFKGFNRKKDEKQLELFPVDIDQE